MDKNFYMAEGKLGGTGTGNVYDLFINRIHNVTTNQVYFDGHTKERPWLSIKGWYENGDEKFWILNGSNNQYR